MSYVFLAFWEELWKIRVGEWTSRQGVHSYISEWTSRQGVHPYINEWTPPSGCASVHRPMDFPLWDVLEALFWDFGDHLRRLSMVFDALPCSPLADVQMHTLEVESIR